MGDRECAPRAHREPDEEAHGPAEAVAVAFA
jgi:hypothetical protein